MKLAIVGGGPGGYGAAIAAAKRGIEVTLVEKADVGGTCLNHGCIPTKTLLHSANALHHLSGYRELGIGVENVTLNFVQVMQRKQKIVERLRKGVEFLLNSTKVQLIRGTAAFEGADCLLVKTQEGQQRVSFDKAIIATGSQPISIPNLEVDGERVLYSHQLLQLQEMPQSLLVVGGGVVGCEFAQAFARMGCSVILVELLPQLLPNMEEQGADLLKNALKKDKVKVLTGAGVTGCKQDSQGVTVAVAQGDTVQEIVVEKVLVAVGRKPVTAGLGLDTLGMELEKGRIVTDSCMRTNIPNIYAIGDAASKIQLAHVALHQGMVAVDHMLGGHREMVYDAVPFCVYTAPELAGIGMTQKQAEQQGIGVKVGKFPMSANGRSLIEGSTDGFVKVVVSAQEDTVLGIHLVGEHVTEMISGLGGLIFNQNTYQEAMEVIFAHPTISESIGEGILDLAKQAIHMP